MDDFRIAGSPGEQPPSAEQSGRERAHLARLFAPVAGPMPIVAGPPGDKTAEGRPRPVVGDDPAVIAKLQRAGVLRKGERLTQFHARCGLGLSQVRQMAPDEIKKFCDAVEQQEPRQSVPGGFAPKPLPVKFILTD